MSGYIRDFMREMVESGKISGCAAAVYREGKPLFRGFEGYSDIEKRIPVTENTGFRLASMTKPVTAAAVLLCCERGLLRLEDEAGKYLSGFKDMYLARKKSDGGYERGEKVGRPITLLQLLTHSAGFGSGEVGDWQYEKLRPQVGDTLAAVTERYSRSWLAFEPGTAQSYSPVMAFDVAARLVETVSGMPYADFIRKNIFQPLDMKHTSYSVRDFAPSDLAVSYLFSENTLIGKPPEAGFMGFPDGYTGGGAGLISTLDDYVKFAEALRACGGEDGGFLRPESVAAMKKPWLGNDMEGICDMFNWGLGVRVVSAQTIHQPLTAGSFGWSGAYGTHFWVDCKKNVTAVYMHNSKSFGGSGAPHAFAFERAVMQTMG